MKYFIFQYSVFIIFFGIYVLGRFIMICIFSISSDKTYYELSAKDGYIDLRSVSSS